MEENKPLELRSEKVRNIIGQVPPGLLRYGTAFIGLALCMLVAAAAFVPYYPSIAIEVTASQDNEGKVHYTAQIPERAMKLKEHFAFITGRPPVEDPMPVHFILPHAPGVSDTLHVSRSAAWYEVEIYPMDTNGQGIKIPASFTFPAKIEVKRTTFLEWVMEKGKR